MQILVNRSPYIASKRAYSREPKVCAHEAYSPTILANISNLVSLDGENITLRQLCEPMLATLQAITEQASSKRVPALALQEWIPTSGKF